MKNALQKIEEMPMTVAGWLAGTAGIIFIRLLLENFSSPPPSGFLISDLVFSTHLALFFWGLVLMLIIVLSLTVGEKIERISKLGLFGLLIIWLPPIVDLIFSGRGGASLVYIIAPAGELLKYWLTFFPATAKVITLGIGLEVTLILCAIGIYAWQKTKSMARTALALLGSYTAIFIWVSLPSLVKIFADLVNPTLKVLGVNEFLVTSGILSPFNLNFFHPGVETVGAAYQASSVLVLSLVAFLIIFALSIIWFYFYGRKKFAKVFLNSRFLRVAHYFAFILIGLLLRGEPDANTNWAYFLSLAVLFITFYLAWLFAVGINDLEDVDTDKISNTERPLVRGHLSLAEMRNMNAGVLALAFIGALLLGNYTFFLVVIFIAAYYIYSAPPLRLKRVPGFSTFLIAIATLSATMAGFFFGNAERGISSFPSEFLVLILIGITIEALAKDLKDIKGDEASGVKTLAVFLYQSRLRHAVSILLSATFFALPAIIFANKLLLVPGIVLAVVALLLIKFKAQEKYLFLVHFAFIVSIGYLLQI